MLIARDYSRKSGTKVLLFFGLTKHFYEKIIILLYRLCNFIKFVYLCTNYLYTLDYSDKLETYNESSNSRLWQYRSRCGAGD